MKLLSGKSKYIVPVAVSLLLGYGVGKLESRVVYVDNINGYMNLNQLEEISLLNRLKAEKYQEVISSLEASLSGGFIGRSGSSGGIQAFRVLSSRNSSGIKDLDNVVLGINEYFCKYNPTQLDGVLKKALQNELESMGRGNELCKSGR